MDFIRVTKDNLETEHICCAISSNKDPQVLSKKAWMAARMDEGLVFLKHPERGKCFIEYIPAEKAWLPIDADGWMHINCLWVSGKFKGHGYSTELLNACIADAKAQGRHGITILSSPKKLGYLADPKYLAHKGFRLADTAAPYFHLMALPFDENAPLPQFRPQAKEARIEATGLTLYYTQQCPFTAKYVPLLAEMAAARGVEMTVIPLTTTEMAQNAPAAYTSFALFRDGTFLTHEILSEKKFEILLEEIQA